MENELFYPAYIHSIGDNFCNNGSGESPSRITLVAAVQTRAIIYQVQSHIRAFIKRLPLSPNPDSTKVFTYFEVIIASSIDLDYRLY